MLAMSTSDIMNFSLKFREAILGRFTTGDTKKRLLEVFNT